MFKRRIKGSPAAKMTKTTRWLVMANNTEARIYRMTGTEAKPSFSLVEQMLHPEGRLHDQELKEGTPGKSFESWGGSHSRHTKSTELSPHEAESHRFARNIASYLEKALTEQRFDKIVVAAEPHFLGVLLSHFEKSLSPRIEGKIHKDVLFLKDHELGEIFVREAI